MLVKEALGQALEMQPDARAEHLRQFGKASPGLLCEVQRLLAALENAGTGFMRECTLPHSASGTPPDSPTTSRDTMIGRRVGVYQIAELIGVGGMGEVYRAVRADDQYRQNIALKLIRAGQASQFVIERFKNERQILASLEHPNIARLLDGGSTEDGVPYLVMELIEGRTLTAYCNDLNLRVPDRLRLFLQVCGAVQFAHQHLVVHRDIKPGNILVGPQGTVKLLDFGVSKLVSADGFSSDSDLTLTAYRALTPNYASPEQVRGEAISTSSDVYSLGVVLYELLSGHTPYPVTAKSSHAISLAVCEFEPEKPSVVVRRPIRQDPPTGSSRDNNPSSAWLTSKQLRGDLDVIVMTSLRKEPARRYASVQEFALDIRNHLNNLPVTRRADDVVYRSVKFVRRHAVGIAATATVLIALTIGLTMAIVEKRRADRRFAEVAVWPTRCSLRFTTAFGICPDPRPRAS